MSDTENKLRSQLAAAQETVKALSKRMSQLEGNTAELPLQKQLESYQRRISKKSDELEKAESWSALIIENSMDAIIRLDQQGRIQSWNPMAKRMFGYSEAEILGQLIEDTLLPKRMHASNLGNLHRHLKRGKGALMNQRVEGMALCKSGFELPVEFIGSVVKQKETLAYAMVFRDISKRKAIEQKLSDSHANLEKIVEARTGEVQNLAAIIEATVNLVGIADLEGNVSYINPAGKNMLGLELNISMDNLKINHFHSAETNKKLAEDVFPQTLAHGTCEVECEFIDVDSNPIPSSCTFMSLPDKHGSPALMAVIARDLRKEISLQKQVEHGDRLESLGVLAGGIAHDFNNILTAILGNVGIAKRKLDSYSLGLEYLENIEQSSLQAANLCKQMLAYSGKGNFVVKPINLSKLISEMDSLLRVSIDKSVVLKVDLCNTLPAVDADVTQIQQIIMNLVINASEAIDKHSGVITIATGIMQVDKQYLLNSIHKQGVSVGRFIYLEVSDSGCGMDEDTRKKIFDPFFTTKFTGRGLGMSAVLGIVHGHQGLLNLYSEPNKGTTFKIALPMSTLDEILTAETDTITTENTVEGLILIIDDEENIREMASIVLEDMGYQVITAVDGKHGVEVFKEQQENIIGVLLDMTMPHMNGEDCYSELRNIKPNIKVILSSGYSEDDATSRFKGKGLAGFIQKPYLIDHFQKEILECFTRK